MSDSQDVRQPDNQRVERLIDDITIPSITLPNDFSDDMESQIAYMSMISYLEDNQRRENERIAAEKLLEFQLKSQWEEQERRLENERKREEMRREYEERKMRRRQNFSTVLRYLRNFRLDKNISELSASIESYIQQYIEHYTVIHLLKDELDSIFSLIHTNLYDMNKTRNPISEIEYQNLISIFDEKIQNEEKQNIDEENDDEYVYEE